MRLKGQNVNAGEHCAICGSRDLKVLFEAGDRNFGTTPARFIIARCEGCGVAQTLDVPFGEEARRFYPDVYYPTTELDGRAYERYIGRYQRAKLRGIRRFKKSGMLLDVGCGVGYFLREAGEHGFKAEGIEYSEVAAKTGRERFGLSIATGDALTAPLTTPAFDVITLWQVLEHLRNPRETLRKLGALLNPEGLLVIAVPNISSVQALLFRSRWYHLDVPRHLMHYDPASLRRLLAEEGFAVKHIDHFSSEHNWAGYFGSALHMAPPALSLRGKLMRKTVGIPLSRCLAFSESALGKGGTITVFAVKAERNQHPHA